MKRGRPPLSPDEPTVAHQQRFTLSEATELERWARSLTRKTGESWSVSRIVRMIVSPAIVRTMPLKPSEARRFDDEARLLKEQQQRQQRENAEQMEEMWTRLRAELAESIRTKIAEKERVAASLLSKLAVIDHAA